ncbi:MAG: hypothetical protein EXR50_00385 [Dehalococcoidia bacterium]|nr:hypothetical protein [Dehalococcoidia bacterium]
MAGIGRTWWGKRFIEALEQFTDRARLGRGRSYALGGRILDYQIKNGKVRAKVRGSTNSYYGVYEEPIYTTTVALEPISPDGWSVVIADLMDRAAPVAKLLLNEMPEDIDDTFGRSGLQLLPADEEDFTTDCSCPDYYNPCKHIAGLCYVLASVLDQDPFLLFELRGLAREQLRVELERSPLGQLLASEFDVPEPEPQPALSYYTRPVAEPAPPAVSYKEFWTGARRLPGLAESSKAPVVAALLIRKGGDYPPFWLKDKSFISVMEEIYERVRAKSPQMK